ncbi:TrmH family RNA methyltransferase [Caulobacter sp. KR2-114]|uniref:TrmH family RNA methyltransferase n=1 Tax=Caulobacter sp. KR2-114 TaxID=3400912 RepID=UPI003C08583C
MARYDPGGVAQILSIDDPDDPRVAAFRDIRERDLVGRQGRFIAEGEVVLRNLARSPRHRTVALLIAAQRLPSQADLIARFAEETPVYAAGQAVMDAIVGFPIHRGLLALGERAPEPSAAEALAALEGQPDALVLALFGIANHDNMGGLFRNAAAFGADLVLLDPTCCDPLYRKALRVSVGGALLVPSTRLAPGEDSVALLRGAGFQPLALSPMGRERLSDLTPPRRAALLLGAEGPGLPAELIARADSVRIPMAGGFDSLNVATTSGIVLHHLTAGRR